MNENIRSDLRTKAIRFLSYKPRTISEITRMAAKELRSVGGVSLVQKEDITNELIQDLQKMGYVNDGDYAITYIDEQKRKSIPKGPHTISQFLQKKGVSREVINKALLKTYSHEDEEEIIKKILEKNTSRDPKKMVSYLRQRGFNYEVIYSLVDRNNKRF